jgi:hypothetical protein
MPAKEVLRMFGPKMQGAIKGWRKLHNEQIYNLLSSQADIRIMQEIRNSYKISHKI